MTEVRDLLADGDRRAAPARRVHTRRDGVDILWCGHGVDTDETVERTDLNSGLRKQRLKPETLYRRCVKCALGQPIEYVIPSPGY